MKYKRHKHFLLGLMIILGLSFTACSGEASNKADASTSIESSTQEEFSSDEEFSTAPESIPEEPEIVIGADYNESFTLVPGQSIYIHSENISFSLDKINYYESGLSDAYYTLTIDGTSYDGIASWIDNTGSLFQWEYTPQRVIIEGADTDLSVSFKLSEPAITPDPLILSGNPEDVYVTTKQEYVVSDDIILFLCEGATLYGDTMELIHTIKDLVEKETGLKLDANSEYADVGVRGTIDQLYGQGAFPGVDPDTLKFHIYIVPFETSSPGAMKGCIILNPMDLEIAAGDGYAFVHELTHCTQMANGKLISTTMDEGFSTYITGQIADRDEIISFTFDAEHNYSYYERKITSENAETIFCEVAEDNWEKYCYGYRFMTYLYETYGDDIYRNILFDASKSFDFGINITEEMMVPIIKRNTTDTVFEDFAKWLSKNQKRFDGN